MNLPHFIKFLALDFLLFVAMESFAQTPPELLSKNTLFKNIATGEIDPINRPFAPLYPLWSDEAKKSRWIELPFDTKIDTSEVDDWVFPVGTKFWKEFAFRDLETGELRRVETRLIQKVPRDGHLSRWEFYTYVWEADGSDAVLDDGSGDMDVMPTSPSTSHDIPNRAACVYCHTKGGEPILAFNAVQLSTTRDPKAPHQEALPEDGLNLAELNRLKFFSDELLDDYAITTRSSNEKMAIGYLFGNCSNCHNPYGSASGTGFYTHYSISEAHELGSQPAISTSLNVPNGRHQLTEFRIKGGDPSQSSVVTRLNVQGHFFPRMPIIGPERIDQVGIALLSEWIRELPRP